MILLKHACLAFLGIVFLVTVLGGCSSILGEDEPSAAIKVELEMISLSMPQGANGNWPARIELVRSSLKAGHGEQLLRIDTQSWFDKDRTAFRAAHPQAVFDYWEVVPGTTIGPFEAEVAEEVEGILFCGVRSYPPPLRLDKGGELKVNIDDGGCTIEQLKEPAGNWWNPAGWF